MYYFLFAYLRNIIARETCVDGYQIELYEDHEHVAVDSVVRADMCKTSGEGINPCSSVSRFPLKNVLIYMYHNTCTPVAVSS